MKGEEGNWENPSGGRKEGWEEDRNSKIGSTLSFVLPVRGKGGVLCTPYFVPCTLYNYGIKSHYCE